QAVAAGGAAGVESQRACWGRSAMAKQRFPGFAGCMRLMRKKNAALREEGFHWLLPRAAEFVAELIEEFRREPEHGLRCWLLELIGEARDSRAVELMVEQLHGKDEAL